MYYDDRFRQDGFEGDIDINISNANTNTNTNLNFNQDYDYMAPNMAPSYSAPMMGSPIVEADRERYVYRNIVHQVPQECPYM